MRQLILVRHGEPTHVAEGLTGGWTDSALTNLGRRQAAATGRRLAELLAGRSCGFYSSDLRRAQETAEIIGAELGAAAQPEPGLREFNNGQAANMRKEDAHRIEVPPPCTREEALDWAPYPGSETWRTMMARVSGCMDEIAESGEDTVLVVTHGAAGQAIVTWWLGLEDLVAERAFAFDLDLCSISHLTVNRWDERTITKLNDTAHLAGLSR